MPQINFLLILLTSILTLVLSNNCPTIPSQEIIQYQNLTSILDTILARGYLKVGTTGDYRPFSYLISNSSNSTTNPTFIGADIDQAHSLSSALNLPDPIRFIPTSFANLSSDLAAGKFDIGMSGISITTLRAQEFFLSIPYQAVGQAACVLCSQVSKYEDGLAVIDQSGVRVAVNIGGENERFDRANLKYADLVVVKSNKDLYQTILDGKADVVISDMVEVTLESKLSDGRLCVANPGRPFNFVEKGYLMGRDGVWKGFVDVWLRMRVESGEWNRTLTRWLDYNWVEI